MPNDRYEITSIRTTRGVVEQLKMLRGQLQARQRFGRVTLEDAISFAVSSANAGLQQRCRDGPPP